MPRFVLLCTWAAVSLNAHAQKLEPIAPEAPIVAPVNVAPVNVPENLQRALKQFSLDRQKASVFHDPRNILELSYYGDRRGVPLPHKATILIEYDCQRFWLANQFPHPDPTTVIGPFEGNAINELSLLDVMREGMEQRNYGTQVQAISGLLTSNDPDLAKLGLNAVPLAMNGEVRDVHSFLHFIERSLPKRRESFVEMGLATQTEAALASMDRARQRIAAVTVEADRPQYQPGYDPAREQRQGVGPLPEESWGEERNGLQAALTMPGELKLNQRADAYFVFRNVSDATVRVSFREPIERPGFGYKDSPHLWRSGSGGSGGLQQAFTHWALEPGQQAVVRCQPLQIMKAGTPLSPKDAIEDGRPGVIRVQATASHWDEWDSLPDGEERLITVPTGDWKGHLETGLREVTLQAEEAPFLLPAPPELGPDSDLKPILGIPDSLHVHHSEAIPLRPTAYLYLGSDDTHWLVDHSTYHKTTSWGPINSDRLGPLGLLDFIEKNTRQMLALPAEQSGGFTRIASLVSRARPVAALGLQLVPDLKIADANPMHPERVARTIRNERPRLLRLGLEEEMRAALALLSTIDPPLPAIDQFEVISNRDLPPGLPADAWGPENDGLCAAALMPKVIAHGSTPVVRLFIRNTSRHDIALTVADRPGYDYATATDATGNALPTRRPLLYPMGFSSVIAPEYDPGLSQQNPPLANLVMLLLKPGAIYELNTATALGYVTKPQTGTENARFGTNPPKDEPALTAITAEPTEALVTWHLRTTNGAARDLKSGTRIWPAKGGWSGTLETAPQKVSLRE